MRIFVVLFILLVTGCSVPQVITETYPPALPGVDSSYTHTAWHLAEESFAQDTEAAAYAAEEGRDLALLADSLLEPMVRPQIRDTIRALSSFNEGADVLDRLSESDSLQALELLETAALKFEEALEADAFDAEARQWLARVYQTLANRFQRLDALEDRVRVLQRLVRWNQDRHDYIALLAAAQEGLQTEAAGIVAGALWERAALVVLDDVEMGLRSSPDSAALFTYHVRASRAFVLANRGVLARESLHRARRWQRSETEQELIFADSTWLHWDGGNMAARKRFDALLSKASTTPGEVMEGLEILLQDIRSPDAQIEVRHQIARIRYASGEEEHAISLMQSLVVEAPHRETLVEDYAVMMYNLAQKLRQSGNLRRALAYLLQCTSLDVGISARSAFDAALLLRNNLDEALRYAHIAEARKATLDVGEHSALMQYLAELYRRSGDRERARQYLDNI